MTKYFFNRADIYKRYFSLLTVLKTVSPSVSPSPISTSPLTCIVDRASPISPDPSSPTLSAQVERQRKRVSTESTKTENTKRVKDDGFDDFLMELKKPRNKAEIFCTFLQSRLQDLEEEYYLRITHTFVQELLKVEMEQAKNKH